MGFIFCFNDTATTEIYTLSLHDALPICSGHARSDTARCSPTHGRPQTSCGSTTSRAASSSAPWRRWRSEEHTSELQSRQYLVCRLLLETKSAFSSSLPPTLPCAPSLRLS